MYSICHLRYILVAILLFKSYFMKVIDFKGIVRATSPQIDVEGNCEEIINMRQEQGAWRVVGKKKLILQDVTYEQVFVHQYSDFENYIGVKDGKVIWFASLENGKVVQKNKEICKVTGKVVLKQINNVLLIRDDITIAKSVFFEGNYEKITKKLPDIANLKLSYEKRPGKLNDYTKIDYNTDSAEETKRAKEIIAGLINKAKEESDGYTEGRVFVCTTYELFDGTETKPSAPLCVELGKFVKGIIRCKTRSSSSEPGNHRFTAEVRVKDLDLQKLFLEYRGSDEEVYKDIVKSVNFYATPAYSYYDLDNINPGYALLEDEPIEQTNDTVPEKKLKKNELEKMLFYKVGSADFFDGGSVEVDFDALTTNDTLPVDTSGWVDTTGDMYVYNNRLHLFNVKRSFVDSIFMGNAYSMYGQTNGDPMEMCAFVTIKAGMTRQVLRYDFEGICTGGTTIHFPKVVCFPDSRAEEIVFYDRNFACTPFKVKLHPSATCNMAFGVLDNQDVDMNWSAQSAQLPRTENGFADPLNLIVSEANNPYYFPPQQSYLMPGEVINLALSTEQISTSQIGMYPLYVFTSQGIYALQVGDGNILYSNTIPISAEVAVRGSNVLQTKYGIVFVTDSGLKMISAREIIDLSEPLLGDPDNRMRYREELNIMINDPRTLYLKESLSQLPFVEYIRGAVFGYDIARDEILVSNPEYKYTYVYSFKNRNWYKTTEVFEGFDRHLGMVRYKTPGTYAIGSVTVEPYGVKLPEGTKMELTVGEDKYIYRPSKGMESGAVVYMIEDWLKKMGYQTIHTKTTEFVIAKKPGMKGNKVEMSVTYDGPLRITVTPFAGGTDPVEVKGICDIRSEERVDGLPVFIQSRPVMLGSTGFKKICHGALRGELSPIENRFFMCGIFASNDLINWKCVTGSQNAHPAASAALFRTGQSYRYFTIVCAGVVYSNHTIAFMELEEENVWDNRLR